MPPMHQGMDLSRFKKVSSDKKTTTLRHAKGHEIKIAHSGLTPKMRESLDAMAKHEEVGGERKRFAEGGGTSEEPPTKPVADLDTASPTPVAQDYEEVAPQAPAAPTQAPQDPNALAQPAQAPAQPATRPQKPQQMPVAAEIDVTGQRPVPPPPTPQQVAQDMTNHDLEFQKDMAMGHIEPKTYHDLFAKKDTLGKIGTLFGLLLSGAGSGLSHQPNAVMDMMNKEIERDFDAQQKSQANAHNWYTASKNYEVQKATMQQMEVQNLASLTQMSKVPSEIKQIEASTRSSDADAELKATAAAINRMKIAAVQNLQDQANKLPPGPQKDAAQKGVELLSNAVQGSVNDTNLATADKIAARDKLRAMTEPAADDNGVDMEKLNHLVGQSRANASLDMPSMVNEQDLANVNKEAKDVSENRAVTRMYADTFKKMDQAAAAGRLNPNYRKALLTTLVADIGRKTTGQFNPQEAMAQAEAMFPDVKDYGKARGEKFDKAMQFFSSREAGTTTLDRLGLKKPFPYTAKGEKGGSLSKYEGKSLRDKKTGKVGIVKNGKLVIQGETKQATK